MVRIYDRYILLIKECSLITQEIPCFLSQTPAILFPHMLKYISVFSSKSPPADLRLQLIRTRQFGENHDWLIFLKKKPFSHYLDQLHLSECSLYLQLLYLT